MPQRDIRVILHPSLAVPLEMLMGNYVVFLGAASFAAGLLVRLLAHAIH